MSEEQSKESKYGEIFPKMLFENISLNQKKLDFNDRVIREGLELLESLTK